jgi:uncharacterized circularly permuted ATP-grasp superfamily protein
VPFDEMLTADSLPRTPYKGYFNWHSEQKTSDLIKKSRDAETIFRKTGITFAVYGKEDSSERLIPFDIVPRIISGSEWRKLAQGIEQRVMALNAFLDDIYHKQEIIKAGRVPRALIEKNDAFLPEMIGMRPPGGVYTHIIGTDIVRTGEGQFYVLEDNARTPSGVSYMLENRETMMQMFPGAVSSQQGSPGRELPEAAAPEPCRGRASGMQGQAADCGADTGHLQFRLLRTRLPRRPDGRGTCRRLRPAGDRRQGRHAHHARLPGDRRALPPCRRRFLDPLSFRPDSTLGVPGIMDVYRAGNITIANAPGTGIADDKAIYSYMPEIVEFYTGEKPILRTCRPGAARKPTRCNTCSTISPNWWSRKFTARAATACWWDRPQASASGSSSQAKLKAKPGNYIAQPTLSLSTVPILVKKGLAPRHVDLRPFVLVSNKIQIIPGGLTRVALKEGSLVVNSSQGGGTKDTWVLED